MYFLTHEKLVTIDVVVVLHFSEAPFVPKITFLLPDYVCVGFEGGGYRIVILLGTYTFAQSIYLVATVF